MEKLQRLKNKLAELGYHCDTRTDNNLPCLKLWLDDYMAYIVYATGEFDTGNGIILATAADQNKIQNAIRQWADAEGLSNKPEEA